jgi:hypothetical protein
MKNKNFIIFAHGRSGSNSFANILQNHPKIKILYEPFNKKWQKKDKPSLIPEIEKIKDITSLEKYLKIVYKENQGIKHLFEQTNEEFNKHLLKNKNYKIIFLTRKNILKSIISKEIALKIKIWDTWKTPKEELKKLTLNHQFTQFSTKKLRIELYELKNNIKKYKKFLTKNKILFFEVIYEELYDSKKPLKEKLEKIQEIFEFLGYERINDSKIIEKIKENFDPNKRKMNDFETYHSIPNILEIEKKLSNKKNGFLFNLKEKLKISQIKLKKIKQKLKN